MTTLGLNTPARPQASVALGFRGGWLKHIGVVIGGAGGAAVVLGAFQILSSQPDKAFSLLQGWGGGFVLAMLAIVILGKFLEGLIQAVKESFSMVASSVQSSAEAQGRTAEALTSLAQQGGEQARETNRLATFAAQESQNVYERLDRQDEVLDQVAKSIDAIKVCLFDRSGGESNGVRSRS